MRNNTGVGGGKRIEKNNEKVFGNKGGRRN